ncbi:MAG: HlyD family secretion protein [Bacillota bacterium]
MRGRYTAGITVIIVLIVMGLTGGCGNKKTGPALEASGTIEADETNLSAEIGGKITELKVIEGQQVKSGDLLGHIDSTIPALQVQQAEAAVKSARAKAKETKTGNRSQLIQQAKANLQQIGALQTGALKSMENADQNFKRIKSLYEGGAATEAQLTSAQTQADVARSQYQAYSAQYKAAQEQLDLLESGATAENITMTDANLAQAEAQLAIARANLAKTELVAPLSGTVTGVNINKGEVIMPGAHIVTIADLNNLRITVYIPEKSMGLVKVGQQAEITTDPYPDKKFTGEVSYISPEAEFTPKNLQTKEERVNMVFAVKIKIKEGRDLLKPGLPADVRFK